MDTRCSVLEEVDHVEEDSKPVLTEPEHSPLDNHLTRLSDRDATMLVTEPTGIAAECIGNSYQIATEGGQILLIPSDASSEQPSLLLQNIQSSVLEQAQGHPLLVLAPSADKTSYEAGVILTSQNFDGDSPSTEDVEATSVIQIIQAPTAGDEEQLSQMLIPDGEQKANCALQQETPSPTGESKDKSESTVKGVQPILMHQELDGNGVTSFICDVENCGRRFTTAGYLKYHQMAHQQQKVLRCPYKGCNRNFFWPSHFKYHQMTHTGSRCFTCMLSGCNKSFFTAQRLEVHLCSHTGVKPYVCMDEGCGKAFTTAGNLRNHERVHTGERPYPCTEMGCGRRFAEYSSLKKHLLVHSGAKPYCCPECGKLFSQSGSRNVHYKRHHGGGGGVTKQTVDSSHGAMNADTTNKSEALAESQIQFSTVASTNNVVVLSEPQMASLATSLQQDTAYHAIQPTTEETNTYVQQLMQPDLNN